MNKSQRPLSKKQLSELKGYIALGVTIGRAVFFLIVTAILLTLSRKIYLLFVWPLPNGSHPVWWIIPPACVMAWVYKISARWTGGRDFRNKVREDVKQGILSITQVDIVDAIEIEEIEDEGPTYFVETADGQTMLFTGQYLESYRRKGFPWKSFEIREALNSKVFFGLSPLAKPLNPSLIRAPLSWDEYKTLTTKIKKYGVLEVPFESLKEQCAQLAPGPEAINPPRSGL